MDSSPRLSIAGDSFKRSLRRRRLQSGVPKTAGGTMWLTGRLAPDFKTIADFRKDNGVAIRAVCAQFVGLCRRLKLFTDAVVAIDGSKFKAVNNRDKNYTVAKVTGRMEQVDASIARYLRAGLASEKWRVPNEL